MVGNRAKPFRKEAHDRDIEKGDHEKWVQKPGHHEGVVSDVKCLKEQVGKPVHVGLGVEEQSANWSQEEDSNARYHSISDLGDTIFGDPKIFVLFLRQTSHFVVSLDLLGQSQPHSIQTMAIAGVQVVEDHKMKRNPTKHNDAL